MCAAPPCPLRSQDKKTQSMLEYGYIMINTASTGFSRRMVLFRAFKFSIPVLLGYSAIGVAYGLMVSGSGYPFWLAPFMSLWMYAGAGQFIAVGLFTAGTTLWELCLVQLVVNARHIAYGFSMLKRFGNTGIFKPYLVFSLTDETFALLSSLPEVPEGGEKERKLFLLYVSLLDQFYWFGGSFIGAIAGTLIPFSMDGIGFALTALFVVLMMEQIKNVKKPGIFILSAASALAGVFFFPGTISILAAMALALVFAPFLKAKRKAE